MVQDVEQTITMLLLILVGGRMLGLRDDGPRPGPVSIGAVVLFALVCIPTVAQALDGALLGALERRPEAITVHHEYWRLLTSELVQDGGVAGAIYNLVTLAVVATFATWFWGGPRSIAIFFLLGVAFDVVNVLGHQAGAGNSGATYGLVATLAGYGLIRAPRDALRVRCAIALAAGGVIWALGNVHGYAILAGGVLGVVLALLRVSPSLADWRERIRVAGDADRRSRRASHPMSPAS